MKESGFGFKGIIVIVALIVVACCLIPIMGPLSESLGLTGMSATMLGFVPVFIVLGAIIIPIVGFGYSRVSD